ncbi:MAG: ISAs1 family transposase [Acidobacteria bacterium]|nr:ISAs1 family transposase [Acidobacteriota bacterium]
MRNQPVLPSADQQQRLDGIRVRLLDSDDLARCYQLLDQHHYLGSLKPVGERLHYAVTDAHGHWLGVLVFCAAARRLRPRDQWIGWSDEQRRRRLPLVVNNARFLLLPDQTFPNLASKTLHLVLARLSDDWLARYAHPVLVVETFVDPEQFCGTLYTASGWQELGPTDGCGRHARDYYVRHDRPKRLFCRELFPNARRSLQAEHLRPALAAVEAKAPPRPTQTARQWRSLIEHFQAVPDYRARIGFYPLYSLLAVVAAAHLADAPRGQKDLAAFAARLSQRQRRTLGFRKDRHSGRYPAPSQPTFCRLYAQVDARAVEAAVLEFQRQLRGPPPPEDLIVLDGKQPRHTGGQRVLTAVTVPSQHYLGSAMVAGKTNEIPVARELFPRLELDGRVVSLDALHTQADTARALVLEHGADYLLTVKANQAAVKENIERRVDPPPAAFPP